MAGIYMSKKFWRVSVVVGGSAAAFIVLAVLFFWAYFTNRGAVSDPSLNEGLATLQVLFYLVLVVHMLASFAAAAALIIWTRAPKHPTVAAVGVTFALLMVPLLLIMTSLHLCYAEVSFPIPGQSVSCD